MSPGNVALIIMAKAPEPGLAKTRLIPALGVQGSASLAEQLLKHTTEIALSTQRFHYRELCVTPDINHRAFTEVAPTFVMTDQGNGDLGARMQRAFERVLSDFDAAVMVGTDAPCMTAQLLDQAAYDLSHHGAVFAPALDGGYTLIGLTQAIAELFVDMPWSTGQVMSTTRARLRKLDVHWHEYPPMADIDEPNDLVHLPSGWLR